MMKEMWSGCPLLLALAGLAGCSTAPPEPGSPPSQSEGVSSQLTTVSPQSVDSAASALAAQYEFPLHLHAQLTSNLHVYGFVGQSETIATYNNLPGVTAFSGVSSPQMVAGWPVSVEAHDAMARAYLIRVGIPEGELGTLHHFTGRSEGTPMSSPNGAGGGVEASLGFATTFMRVVSGVWLPDSHAGVQLNQAGVPVTISISWPQVPTDVVQLALSMRAQLGSSWHLPAAFTDSSGQTEGDHQIVIRHDLAGAPSLRFVASVRTILNGTRTSYVDTDLNGQVLHEFDPHPSNVVIK